jgi:hypothetical protein
MPKTRKCAKCFTDPPTWGVFPFKHVASVTETGKGGNGEVRIVTYQQDGETSKAVMKFAKIGKSSDSLAYEFFVGKWVNQYLDRFPCFIETYDLGHFVTKEARRDLKHSNAVTTFNKNKVLRRPRRKEICTSPHQLAILIQYVEPSAKFRDLYDDPVELASVLFQIYMPLSVLSEDFTHYDLHKSNIMLCCPYPGKYIQYHYHTEKTVSFKSMYIAKIIDYGRCYVAGNKDNFFNKYNCDKTEAEFRCYRDKATAAKKHYSSCATSNRSADLRLLKLIGDSIPTSSPLVPFFDKVVYDNDPNLDSHQHYGSMELPDAYPKVQTVRDAARALADYVRDAKVDPSLIVATIDVYPDRPMQIS